MNDKIPVKSTGISTVAAPPPPPPDAETKEAPVTPVLQRMTEMTDNEIFPVFVPIRYEVSSTRW